MATGVHLNVSAPSRPVGGVGARFGDGTPCSWHVRDRQGAVERLEQRHPAAQQVVVVRMGQSKAIDQETDGRSFRKTELVILEVEIVHDARDTADRRLAQSECLAQHLEGTVLTAVRELDTEHVEGHRIVRRILTVGTKSKRALRSMKRRISHADDMRSTPGRGRVTQSRPRYERSADACMWAARYPGWCSSILLSSMSTWSRPALAKKSTRSIANNRSRSCWITRRTLWCFACPEREDTRRRT